VNPNKALWEKGDFTRIASSLRESGEALVGTLGIARGLKVLDLGCGDGTTAVPAAKLGADVLGVDIASNLVAAGNQRAEALGLKNLRFEEGDASNLAGVRDKSFDLVISIFGAMFAPKPFDVAREMVRVTRPGGRIVMGNWIPNDPTLIAQILKISAAYSPPPLEGFISPMGRRGKCGRALCRRGRGAREYYLRQGHVQVDRARPAGRTRRHVRELLRPHHERARGGGQKRTRRRSAQGAGCAVRKPERKPAQGRHLDRGDLPARDCRRELEHRNPKAAFGETSDAQHGAALSQAAR
jgi:SAM-dependent methyltransferase